MVSKGVEVLTHISGLRNEASNPLLNIIGWEHPRGLRAISSVVPIPPSIIPPTGPEPICIASPVAVAKGDSVIGPALEVIMLVTVSGDGCSSTSRVAIRFLKNPWWKTLNGTFPLNTIGSKHEGYTPVV